MSVTRSPWSAGHVMPVTWLQVEHRALAVHPEVEDRRRRRRRVDLVADLLQRGRGAHGGEDAGDDDVLGPHPDTVAATKPSSSSMP